MELQYWDLEALAGSSGVISSAMPAAGPRVCVPMLPGGTRCWEGAAGDPHCPHQLQAESQKAVCHFVQSACCYPDLA